MHHMFIPNLHSPNNMKKKTRIFTKTIAALFALSAMASASKIEQWPYGKLHEEADIVAVARAVSTVPSGDKWEAAGFEKDRFKGVETTLELAHAFKGKPADSFKLLHFQYKDPSASCNDGPGLVSFLTGARPNDGRQGGGESMPEIQGDSPEYLLFLKKRADGRFEPVSGQVDPDASVRMLSWCDWFQPKAGPDLLTTEEIYAAEPPAGLGWRIEKEWKLGKQTTFKALFDFTKKGNGALHLGGDLWVSVFDSHQDTTLFPGDHLLKMELKDLNNDSYLDLKIDGSILLFGEKDEEVIHTEPVCGEFIYMPAEGVFKPRFLQMLTLHSAEAKAP